MGSHTRSKVARLIEEYDLTGIGGDLERAWLGEGAERQSLRALADRFNRALLLAAIRDAGMDIVDGEGQNYYRLLSDDSVSAGKRVEARTRLEQAGIDVAGLQEDFVTYQAIRHYLTEVRDVSYDGTDDTDSVQKERGVLERVQSRVESVVRDTVDRLRGTDDIAVGEYRVFVSVDILCQECGGQFRVSELVSRGKCACDG
jgi:hypothetical protein